MQLFSKPHQQTRFVLLLKFLPERAEILVHIKHIPK